jgi:hypothetical protein
LLILFGGTLPVGIMVPILAKLMGDVTFLFMRTKIKADPFAIFDFAFIGEGLIHGSSFLDIEESHF